MGTSQVRLRIEHPQTFGIWKSDSMGRSFEWGGVVRLETDQGHAGIYVCASADSDDRSDAIHDDWSRRLRWAAAAAISNSKLKAFEKNKVERFLPSAETDAEPDPWLIPVSDEYLSELTKEFQTYAAARSSFDNAITRLLAYSEYPAKLKFTNDSADLIDFVRRSLRASCPGCGDGADFRKLADAEKHLEKLATRKDTTSSPYRELQATVFSELGYVLVPHAWIEAPPILA